MRALVIVVLCVFSSFGLSLPAQAGKAKGKGPSALLTRLEDDTERAMSRVDLTTKDRDRLAKALQKLQKNVDAREQGQKMNHGEIHKALDEITKVSPAFHDEDRRAVMEDIADIRERKLDVERAPRQPRPRPYPRRSYPYPRTFP